MGDDVKEYLAKHTILFEEGTDLNTHLPHADIVYMTRIQRERMSEDIYQDAKDKYSITEENLGLLKDTARLMHPLPRVSEIALPVFLEQTDKRIAYFRQAENGLYMRMALLSYFLG